MSSKNLIVASALVFLLGSSVIVFGLRKKGNSVDNATVPQDQSSIHMKRLQVRLKNDANAPISFKQILVTPPLTNDLLIQDKIPASCRKVDIVRAIIKSTGYSLADKTQTYSDEAISCLVDLGGPRKCFSTFPESDDNKNCLNNLIIARARLVDNLSVGKPLDTLDIGILSNKIISRIYNKDKSIDEMGPEIFSLSDKIIKLDPENQEAHDIRAYSAIPSLRQKFDTSVLEKGKESASFLASFPDQRFLKRSIISQFSYSLIDFLVSKEPSNLETAELLANEFISMFPNLPEGFHMKATVDGYKNKLDSCKKLTQKGIDVGGKDQPGYADYVAIIKSIDTGTFKIESLGVRFDPSETFRPDELLQSTKDN